ncbi:MAG: glycosyltransferase family 2 protein [Prevotellaceae bacterium]|jgi:GT2 family glycosyltransferase|nr:glycosyltransferase family 2 protein [Prevotellaceae bacterium]
MMKTVPIKVTVITSLYRCEAFLEGYFHYVSQLEHTEEIEILLLHNDPLPDEQAVIHKQLPALPFVKYHIVPVREGLYATWNRGIKLAKGEYVCIWNVDDIRFPRSIHWQAEALDAHPEAWVSYGDIIHISSYETRSNPRPITYPDYATAPHRFFKEFCISCFPMWRKQIQEQVGYFDEQFKLVGDYDFQFRVAMQGSLVKAPHTLGYFLGDCSHKLSANIALQEREHTLLYLRYGWWDRLNWVYLGKVHRTYHAREYRWCDAFHPIVIPARYQIGRWRRMGRLLLSVFRQPRYVLSYIKHVVCKKPYA